MKQVVSPLHQPARLALISLILSVFCVWAKNVQAQSLAASTRSSDAMGRPYLNYNGQYAHAPDGVPWAVHRIVDSANQLQHKPYKWGGGHKKFTDRGYDCSGSVSHVLISAGLLRKSMTAQEFKRYGSSGPGKYITLFCKNDHVFMSVCGLRFDTSPVRDHRGKGPKWRPESRSMRGFVVRHPPGF